MKMALVLAALGVVAVVGVAPAPGGADALEIEVVVSPSVVALRSQGDWLTVHADISYWSVAHATLTLDGLPVAWTKADNRGDLVAKFALDEVKAGLEPGTAVLTLYGETLDGTPFSGSDEIRVVR